MTKNIEKNIINCDRPAGQTYKKGCVQMRRHGYIALLLVLIFSILFIYPENLYAQDAKGDGGLSIQEALEMAYKHNPDLLKAELEVEKAEIQKDDLAEAVTWIPTGGLINPAYQQVFNSYQKAEIAWETAKKARDAEKDRLTQEVIAAYAQVVKDYNNMEAIRLTWENMKNQQRIYAIAKGAGLTSDIDYNKYKFGLNELEKGYEALKAKYEGSVAALGALLGQSHYWEPKLTSRAVLEKYERHEMTVEINRALSKSILVLQQKALLDIAETQKYWILPNVSTDLRNIDLSMAKIDYEQAKRTARSTIESLYHGLDALEGQIEAAQLAYDNAVKDLEVAKLKYEIGMTSRYSMNPSEDSLASLELNVIKKGLELESLKADLASTKAMFAYLTGKEVYTPSDWRQ